MDDVLRRAPLSFIVVVNVLYAMLQIKFKKRLDELLNRTFTTQYGPRVG